MLRSTKAIKGYKLAALDGTIGRCKDLLFDDEFWTVRYMVADTGRWLPGRKVVIPPTAFGEPDWASKTFPVRLTKEQIENAPPLEEHAPVSRQYEEKFYDYYGWSFYWADAYAAAHTTTPPPVYGSALEQKNTSEVLLENPHLRSVGEVTGYYIHALDGEIGHVEEFILDDEAWVLRYMVVDTRNWLPGRKVLLAPEWVSRVDWAENTVHVVQTRERIENSPEYDPSAPVNRAYEERLYSYYGRPVYW